MNYHNHQADDEPHQPAGDEHHHPSVPPGWVDQPAKMIENVYNVPSSEEYFRSENTNIQFKGFLQLS